MYQNLFGQIMETMIKFSPEEDPLIKVCFQLNGIAQMHKVWKQIFINNVLMGILRIEECNATMKKFFKALKESNEKRILDFKTKRKKINYATAYKSGGYTLTLYLNK